MAQTIYLSDEDEKLVLDAIRNKAVAADDRGKEEERDELIELRDKIESGQ